MTNDEQKLFPDEIAHLEMINNKLNEALQEASNSVEKLDKEYLDAKRYMAEYRGEIDPHEMFQNELSLKQIDRTGVFAVGVWDKLSKLKNSPYFARIDFQNRESRMAEAYYIGRFTFHYKNELLIFDWRSPVASMFYDCEIGPAGYDAPVGRIAGRLTCKRQFKVRDGKLEYVLESSINIQDDVLQRELSHTSDEKMKSIISTIQKEQNKIIRNEKTGTIIIQGAAGSGKTSIALHRIAFLLYRFKDKLAAENVTILSPNKVFGDYISTVLPELGEEPVCELSFRDIAEEQLDGVIDFEADKDPLETTDIKWAKRVCFKSTMEFLKKLDRYIQEIPDVVFDPVDYTTGRFSIAAEFIQSRFHAYHNYPVKKRLEMIADEIRERFISENVMGSEIPTVKAILKSLNAMVKIKSILELYKNFYKWLDCAEMFVMPKKKTLEWADVYPFLYLYAAFEGLQENKRIKHLVVDEMQDYTPVQYAVVNRLFPCEKTILGDFGQFINPNHLHSLDDLRQIYSGAGFVELTKSYRSTYEIITFAKSIQRVDNLEAIERHGEAPVLIPCQDKQQEMRGIKEQINSFLKSENVSLGIILKTNSAAKTMHKILAEEYEIQLITPESTSFENGITITSIQMSKGLEFDEVLLPDVSAGTYKDEYDRSLLYIAVTRAMHRLTLLYTGAPARFLLQENDNL